ncbi:MAG: ABC transporter ATP-binding protein, partial [gamma proteobacterium symbiont of Clathrolucina costata]
PLNLPVGCKFAPRCPQAMEVCRAKEPPITRLGEEHYARCWLCEKPEEKR